jgi:hypothetical protein
MAAAPITAKMETAMAHSDTPHCMPQTGAQGAHGSHVSKGARQGAQVEGAEHGGAQGQGAQPPGLQLHGFVLQLGQFPLKFWKLRRMVFDDAEATLATAINRAVRNATIFITWLMDNKMFHLIAIVLYFQVFISSASAPRISASNPLSAGAPRFQGAG